jgi:small neutral amino acid transporter SnatA (MarC family)
MNWLRHLLRQLISLRIFTFYPSFRGLQCLRDSFYLLLFYLRDDETWGKKMIRQTILTAFIGSIAFLGAGESVFTLLGISVADFQFAGGILLFIIAIVDLIFSEKTRAFPKETLGIVPIGIPPIVGPAVLTLLLIVIHTYGYISTILYLILNLLVVWLVSARSHWIMGLMKEGGQRNRKGFIPLTSCL